MLLTLSLCACGGTPAAPSGADKTSAPHEAAAALTAEDATAFVQKTDAGLREVWVAESEAAWANATDITDAHQKAVAEKGEASMAFVSQAVKGAAAFNDVKGIDADTQRQLHLIKLGSTISAPDDAEKRARLATVTTEMEGMYGKGKVCESAEDGTETCRTLGDLEKVLTESRDYDTQLEAWTAWRSVSPAIRPLYGEFVSLGNEGAREIGFDDMGELWRSGYDMDPTAFDAEVERLWQQVKPLYEKLHCHVRAKLSETYGADKVPAEGPIPAHLLGNMWAQSWDNLYPMLTPHPSEAPLDVTSALREKGYDDMKMVKTAESFFTSLGLDPLPDTFWERSMFQKPEGKEAQCHASAWDVSLNGDLRIKMCIKIDEEDFSTIHHELGHNYYYMYYFTRPVVYQNGAHDGFHEGIGDTLTLSITPGYLKEIGLLDTVSETPEGLLNKQMKDALAKIAFLPFGRMIDKWRWGVFSGEITPETYNEAWWSLRQEYQGIASPVARTEADFDPGAKYHIPANTPYMRYFLAHILQFQFHKALCETSGHEGPLHTCSIYGSKEAGEKMKTMLSMGASQPWPDALEAVTGTREMDAGALKEYFAPLEAYLDQQNEGRTCGW